METYRNPNIGKEYLAHILVVNFLSSLCHSCFVLSNAIFVVADHKSNYFYILAKCHQQLLHSLSCWGGTPLQSHIEGWIWPYICLDQNTSVYRRPELLPSISDIHLSISQAWQVWLPSSILTPHYIEECPLSSDLEIEAPNLTISTWYPSYVSARLCVPHTLL